MACVKLCINTGNPRAELCVHIQCLKLGHDIRRPTDPYFVDPVIFEIGEKQQEWSQDVNAVASVAHLAELASPALGKVLNETVSHMIEEVSRRLPEGVSIQLGQH